MTKIIKGVAFYMVKMMRKEQIGRLSAEGRIKNSYEAMYYKTESGDPEADEIVRGEIQHSFRRQGITLSDQPNNKTLRSIMLDAYKRSAQELGGHTLSPNWSDNLTRDFDAFTGQHTSFYQSTFESFENRYKGETVDFYADFERMMQESDEPGFTAEPTDADLNAMQRDRLKKFTREGEMKAAGLSYAGHAPSVTTRERRSYRQIKQEEAAAQEIKGSRYDRQYDRYARNRGDTYQKLTAGDEYGFDDREYDLEDDGPEL